MERIRAQYTEVIKFYERNNNLITQNDNFIAFVEKTKDIDLPLDLEIRLDALKVRAVEYLLGQLTILNKLSAFIKTL